MGTQEKPTEKAFYLQCAECTQKHLANAIAYAADAIPCISQPFEGYQCDGLRMDEKSFDYWSALLMLCRAYINLVETMTGYGDHFVFAIGLLGRAQSHMYAAKFSSGHTKTVRVLRQHLETNGTKMLDGSCFLSNLDELILELSGLTDLPDKLVYRLTKAYAEFAEALREAPDDVTTGPQMRDMDDQPREISEILGCLGGDVIEHEDEARSFVRVLAQGLITRALSLYNKADILRKSFAVTKPDTPIGPVAPAEPEGILQEGGDNHDDQD